MNFLRCLQSTLDTSLANDLCIVLVGARQTGKTTLLRSIYERVRQEGHPAWFINLENLEYLELLNRSPENIFAILPPLRSDLRATVFIDEIQYLKDPSNLIKYFYDEHRQKLKLVVTGSSAFYIDQRFRDSLAGRKRLFHLQTLSFAEFLLFKGREELCQWLPTANERMERFRQCSAFPRIHRQELERLWGEYACYGGYPAVVLAQGEEEKRLMLEDIVHSAAKKDVQEAGIRYPEKYYRLMKLLAAQAGSLVNRHELGTTLGITSSAVDNYLYVLRRSFHLAEVTPFSANIRKELTKMPKYFFLDTGMRNYLVNEFRGFSQRADTGVFLESLVFRRLMERISLENIRFWRTADKHEVDFVVNDAWGLETKSNPATFRPAKYAPFREHYENIPLDVAGYDDLEEREDRLVWPSWGV